MLYNELDEAVRNLNGQVAVIRHSLDPTRKFLAAIESCAQMGGETYLYLFWIDTAENCTYSETMTRVNGANIISLEPSGLSEDEIQTAELDENWESTLKKVFPRPPAD